MSQKSLNKMCGTEITRMDVALQNEIIMLFFFSIVGY